MGQVQRKNECKKKMNLSTFCERTQLHLPNSFPLTSTYHSALLQTSETQYQHSVPPATVCAYIRHTGTLNQWKEGSRHQNDAKSMMVASFSLSVMAGEQRLCDHEATHTPSRFFWTRFAGTHNWCDRQTGNPQEAPIVQSLPCSQLHPRIQKLIF
jgi:hypothetical protein